MNFTIVEPLGKNFVEIQERSIVSRTIFKNDTLTAIMFGFDAGEELSEHTSAREAIIHILDGEATILLENRQHAAKSGTWIRMAPDLPHSINALTQLWMILILL